MHFPRLKKIYEHRNTRVLPIKSGMMLELHERVGEGDNTRIQKFKGLVIQVKKPQHIDGTFTIRGTVARMTVERIFPLSFPKFEKVLLLDQYKLARARINYIRDKVGKDAKMKSILSPELKETDLLATAIIYQSEQAVQEVAAEQTDNNEESQAPIEQETEDTATPEQVAEPVAQEESTEQANETETPTDTASSDEAKQDEAPADTEKTDKSNE